MSDQNVIWSDYVFEGKLINVRIDTVQIPGSGNREREIVEHPGAVAILPVLEDGRMVLVRQYRPAVGRELLEVPAGTMEPDERPEDTARRELTEETGYAHGSLRKLVQFFVSPGWCNEELSVYVAEGLTPGNQSLADDEHIEIELVTAQDVPGLIGSADIADAKTIVALTSYLGLSLAESSG